LLFSFFFLLALSFFYSLFIFFTKQTCTNSASLLRKKKLKSNSQKVKTKKQQLKSKKKSKLALLVQVSFVKKAGIRSAGQARPGLGIRLGLLRSCNLRAIATKSRPLQQA
jgi:hypothetical protein